VIVDARLSNLQGIRDILGVDADFPVEMIAKEDWIGRRLVADRFRLGRMFIAGDASHLWVPYAGYGMNAGIADGLNLSWLLAAHIRGWAPETILDAYEAERKPITEQVSRFAMGYAESAIRERNTLPPGIEDETPEGEAIRQALGDRVTANNVQQFACAGLNYGYYYDASPIVAYDCEGAPGYTMYDYTPSTAPGARVPHFFLADGRSVYDVMGQGFALLVLDNQADVAAMVDAAASRGVPLMVVPVDRALDAVPECYTHGMVLSRPDFHVAWRGDVVADAGALIDRVRGGATD